MKPEDFGIKTDFICALGIKVADIPTGEWCMYPPVIDQEKCIKCGQCVLYCPVKSIIEENEKIVITYGYCKGCGVCINECPKEAISFDTTGGQVNNG